MRTLSNGVKTNQHLERDGFHDEGIFADGGSGSVSVDALNQATADLTALNASLLSNQNQANSLNNNINICSGLSNKPPLFKPASWSPQNRCMIGNSGVDYRTQLNTVNGTINTLNAQIKVKQAEIDSLTKQVQATASSDPAVITAISQAKIASDQAAAAAAGLSTPVKIGLVIGGIIVLGIVARMFIHKS